MKTDRARGGNTMASLLVLLLLLGGAGAWNYHRNVQLELAEQKPRRFEAYSDSDLASLADAYRAELEQWQRRYAASSRAHGTTRSSDGLIGERVKDFERVQRRTGLLRELKLEIATREHRLAEITDEQEHRANVPAGLALHVQRLTRI